MLFRSGFLISTVDIPILNLASYPIYEMIYDDSGLGEVIQEYVAHNMLGDVLRLDILPDLLGYLLIAVGIGFLVRFNKRFIAVYIPLIVTVCLSLFIKLVPFLYEGRNLIVFGLIGSFLLLVFELYMEYRTVYLIADSTSDLPNKRDTVLMKFGWIGSAICRTFLYFIVLVGLPNWIIIAYQVVQLGAMVFCLDRMMRCRGYLHKSS